MNHHHTRRRLLGGILGPLLVLGVAAGAAAAPATADGRHRIGTDVVTDSYDSGLLHPDPYFLDVCGVEVRLVGSVTATQTLWDDATVTTRLVEDWDWYDFDSGELVLYQRDREEITDHVASEVVDETAGTVTVVIEARDVGFPVRLFVPHEGVAALAVGLIRGQITLVFDLETGELLQQDPAIELTAGRDPFHHDQAALDQFICGLLA